MMQVTTETISADRTRLYFRDPNATDYWSLEVQTDARARTFYTVTHDGWVVYELTAREVRINEHGTIASECFSTLRMREVIPAEILSHLPKCTK